MDNSNHLEAIENFLGCGIDSPESTELRFSKLSWSQLADLEDRLAEFESVWSPGSELPVDTMHIGRSFYTLNNPLSWVNERTRPDGPFDVDVLTRSLIYLPRISVWLPPIGGSRFGKTFNLSENDSEAKKKSRLCQLAVKLSRLRPFLDDGSLTIIPDRFYADVCGWKEPTDSFNSLKSGVSRSDFFAQELKSMVENSVDESQVYEHLRTYYGDSEEWIDHLNFSPYAPSPMLLHARDESEVVGFRQALDKFEFFDGAEELCSDSRYIWGVRETESIKYINPLNEINEDQVIQSIIGSSSLCANAKMFDLLRMKLQSEALRTNEMAWLNASVNLPGIEGMNVRDLVSVRQNEEAFSDWRTTLEKFIREVANMPVGSDVRLQAQKIFREEVQPLAMGLRQQIKSKSLKSILKSGAVAFGSGAVAAYAINPTPAASIATGGLSSTLKIVHDVWESRGLKPKKALFRMLSVLSVEKGVRDEWH